MKCPICSTEIQSGASACPACGAIQAVQRTPVGAFAGWIGILAAVLTGMLLIPLPLMALFGISLAGFPWVLPIAGVCIAAASFWYSRATKHIVWLARAGTR